MDKDILLLIDQFKNDINGNMNDSFHQKLSQVQRGHNLILIIGLTMFALFIIWLILVSIFLYFYYKRYTSIRGMVSGGLNDLLPLQDGVGSVPSIKSSAF